MLSEFTAALHGAYRGPYGLNTLNKQRRMDEKGSGAPIAMRDI
jgi:hypothetical protein